MGDTYITEGRLQIALGQDKEGNGKAHPCIMPRRDHNE